MRKFFGLLAAVAVLAMAIAGVATAGSNKADGTTVTGTNTTSIALGGVVTCHSSSISGSLTNNAGSGIKVDITSASFTNCTGGTVTSHTTGSGWVIEWGTTTDHITWRLFAITNVKVTTHTFGVTCSYSGNLTGANGSYNESTDRLVLDGSLTSTSGFPCPSSVATSGTYATTPTDLDVNTGAGQNTGT